MKNNELIDEEYDGNSEEKNSSKQTVGRIGRESQYSHASVRPSLGLLSPTQFEFFLRI